MVTLCDSPREYFDPSTRTHSGRRPTVKVERTTNIFSRGFIVVPPIQGLYPATGPSKDHLKIELVNSRSISMNSWRSTFSKLPENDRCRSQIDDVKMVIVIRAGIMNRRPSMTWSSHFNVYRVILGLLAD